MCKTKSKPPAKPEGDYETVTVNGAAARYWAGDPEAEDGVTITVGSGEAIQSTTTVPGEKQQSTLLWQDAQTGVTFRLQGTLDRETMLRIAQSVE